MRVVAILICIAAAAASPFLQSHQAHASPVVSDDFNDDYRDPALWKSFVAKTWHTTPDNPSLKITGDIDIRVASALGDWTPNSEGELAGKWSGNDLSYALDILPDGRLSGLLHDGTNGWYPSSTLPVGATNGSLLLVRMTARPNNGSGQREAKFFTKPSTLGTAAADAAGNNGWTQLGSTVTTSPAFSGWHAGSRPLSVGAQDNGANPVSGTPYALVLKNGINGTAVTNPDFYSAGAGTTPFTDSLGRSWTLHQPAVVSETNQRLEVSITESAAGQTFGAGYTSQCLLTGDFDVQTNYQLVTWPSANGVHAELGFGSSTAQGRAIERVSTYDNREIYTAGWPDQEVDVTTSDQSGSLRMARQGSSWRAYRRDGQSWVQFNAFVGTTTDVNVGLNAFTTDATFGHSPVKVAFDDLSVTSGTVNCGAPIITSDSLIGGCSLDGDAVAPCDTMSDPVIPSTGAFIHNDTDVVVPGGRVPFRIERSYTSSDSADGPLGIGWSLNLGESLTIGGDGSPTLRAANGQRVLYARDPAGTFVGPINGRSTLKSIANGYKLTRRDHTVHSFDTQGRLTKIADQSGNALTFTYGAGGVLDHVTDAQGATYPFTFDGSGYLTRVDLPDGRHVSYGYTSGRLTSVTDLRGKTTTYGYDGGGRLQSVTDPTGHEIVHNTYDASGRVSSQQDAMGETSTFSYTSGANGLMTTTMTDARGKVWQDVSQYNVHKSRTDPGGVQTIYSWDPHIAPSTQPRAGGSPRTLTWDARGNLTSTDAVSPFNYHESYTYDATDHVKSHTDGNDKTTTYGYDASGNLTTVNEPGGATTTITPDATTGLPASITDQRAKTWTGVT